MNLIEELGIEKCQAIVSEVSDAHFFGCTIDTAIYWLNQSNEYHSTPMLFPNMSNQTAYVLDDLRAAITGHDNHWYGRSEAEEIKAYAELSQEKIQGGAVLVGNFTVIQQQPQSEINNCSEKDSSEISITDHCTDNLSHFTDNCTDIRNHISPNTKVIER